MKATNLSRSVWNAIADLASRSQTPREVYFAEVTRADTANNLVWTKDFGDVAIPLVAFNFGFAYYDTVPTGNAADGEPVESNTIRREDKTNMNANFRTHVICPKRGETVVVLDPWGAKRFPICVGVLKSKGAWGVEDAS